MINISVIIKRFVEKVSSICLELLSKDKLTFCLSNENKSKYIMSFFLLVVSFFNPLITHRFLIIQYLKQIKTSLRLLALLANRFSFWVYSLPHNKMRNVQHS